MNNEELIKKIHDITSNAIKEDMGYAQAYSDICALVVEPEAFESIKRVEKEN